MSYSLPTILQQPVVEDRISRLKVNNTMLQKHFGFQNNGPNVRSQDTRNGSYDIFDEVRTVPTSVLPHQEAVTRGNFPYGNIKYDIQRHAEKIPIPFETITNIRKSGTLSPDKNGESYIFDQETWQKQVVTNLREFQTAAMMRGSYTWSVGSNANALTHAYSGGALTVDYQIPAGNKSQLDMLGDGDIIATSWANTASPLLRDLYAIHAAFVELTGLGLTDVWCTSTVWGHVMLNSEVLNVAGSVNRPFSELTKDEETQSFTATLAGCPWLTWHITDQGLDLGGTYTKHIADDAAVFMTRMDGMIASYQECYEICIVNNSQVPAYGEYYYHALKDDPASCLLHSRLNGLPILKVPKTIAYGTVVF